MVAYHAGAVLTALSAYVIVALAVGWLVAFAFADFGPGWPRFLAEAVVSTIVGMIVSWRLTTKVFPSLSGGAIFAAFACVTVASIFLGLIEHGRPPSWLQTLQSLLLITLSFGLFWACKKPRSGDSNSRAKPRWKGRRG